MPLSTVQYVQEHNVGKSFIEFNKVLNYFVLQNGFTPLHVACKKNRHKVVELLLTHKANKEALTEVGDRDVRI